MSIIYEALKKVEKSQSTPPASSPESSGPGSKKEFAGKIKNGLTFILVLALGVFVANILFGLLKYFALKSKEVKNTIQPQKAPLALMPQAAQPEIIKEPPKEIPASPSLPTQDKNTQKAILSTNEARNEPAPKLVLNGLFSSGGQGYALINNHILKEGDSINGAIIKRISPDGVDIDSPTGNVHLSYH